MAPYQQGTRRRVAAKSSTEGKNSRFNRKPFPRTTVPKLNADSDNRGTTAWREGRRPDGEYDLPSGFDPNSSVGALDAIAFIETVTGTRIQLRKANSHTGSSKHTVNIWGDTIAQVNEAKSKLASYVINFDARSDRTRRFSKIGPNLSWEDQVALHKKLKQDSERQKYRKKLSENEILEKTFKCSIVVPWKEGDWRIEDALGQQLEAIDEIRMDGMCYITFSRMPEESNFVLLGNHRGKMIKAAERLQAIPHRVISHSQSPTQLFLFKSMEIPFDYSAFKIKQVDYFPPAYLLSHHRDMTGREEVAGKYFVLLPSGIAEREFLEESVAAISSLHELEDLGLIRLGIKHTTQINSEYLQRWVTTALKHLTSYKGHIRIEATIGTCVFQCYKHGNELKPTAIEDMLLDGNNENKDLDAFTAAGLGEEDGRRVLDQFIESRPILSFYDRHLPPAWSLQECLVRCRPRVRAVFVIEQSASKNLRLEIEYKESEEGTFDEISRRWLQLKYGQKAPSYFMDVNMLDLNNPHISHGLKISRCDGISELHENKLEPVYHQFANEVEPDLKGLKAGSIEQNKRLFRVPAASTVKLRYHEQYRTWLFSIGMTGYYAELYACTSIDFKQSDHTSFRGDDYAWPREQIWGIRVFHERWGSLLSENLELGIGMRTKWQPTESQFFPSEDCHDFKDMEGMEAEAGAGFLELQRVLKIVDDVLLGRAQPKEATKDEVVNSAPSANRISENDENGNAADAFAVGHQISLLDLDNGTC